MAAADPGRADDSGTLRSASLKFVEDFMYRVAAHACNSSAWEVEAGGSQPSNPA